MVKTFFVTGIFCLAFKITGYPVTGQIFVFVWLCAYLLNKLGKNRRQDQF